MEAHRPEERLVSFRPRAILVVLGIILAAVALVAFLFLAWRVITWVLVALFLSLALNPAPASVLGRTTVANSMVG